MLQLFQKPRKDVANSRTDTSTLSYRHEITRAMREPIYLVRRGIPLHTRVRRCVSSAVAQVYAGGTSLAIRIEMFPLLFYAA